jgi:carbamoyltransferase
MAANLVLGINAYHADAAACIVRDAKLIAAAEEERFRGVKHWAGLRFCQRGMGVWTRDLLVG